MADPLGWLKARSIAGGRRLVAASATAVLFVACSWAACFVLSLGTDSGFDAGAAVRVGLASFLGGLVVFPVSRRTVRSRAGFAARGLAAGAAFALVHRVLFAGFAGFGGFGRCAGVGVFDAVLVAGQVLADFVTHPDLAGLLPGAIQGNPGVMEVLAILFSGALAALSQPALAQAGGAPEARAEQRTLAPVSAAVELASAPARVQVRA
jgi:hypothetical protein